MVYGIPFSELEIRGFKLLVSKSKEGSVSYSRHDVNGKIVANVVLDPTLDVILVPLKPMLHPRRNIAECIYLRLDPPIAIGAHSRVKVELAIPVDYGVVARSSSAYNIIDSFVDTSIVPKVALYGTSTFGHICRFIQVTQPVESKPYLANTELSISNDTGKTAIVRNIVVPLEDLKIYYKPGTWLSSATSINMSIESDNTANTWVEETEPSTADYEESPDITSSAPSIVSGDLIRLKKLSRFKMLWGY
ncbi:MAG: DUF432 domain-containing protein [Acidilobaceae archaeon]